jgi:hypothetical protein
VPLGRLRSLAPKFTAMPPQAIEAFLAFTKVPALDAEYGLESAERFKELVSVLLLQSGVIDDAGRGIDDGYRGVSYWRRQFPYAPPGIFQGVGRVSECSNASIRFSVVVQI